METETSTHAQDEYPGQILEEIVQLIAREKLTHRVQLLCLAGSAAVGPYRPGWSDVDVLLVVDDEVVVHATTALVDFNGEHPDVSISILSASEGNSDYRPPKIDYVLRLVNEGVLRPRLIREGQTFLVTNDQLRTRYAIMESSIVVERCRRYLQTRPLKRRAIYKYCTLIARLALRERGLPEPTVESEVLRQFRQALESPCLAALEEFGPALSDEDLRSAATSLLAWTVETRAVEVAY